MSLAEKMGYLRGLADGLNLDEAKDQQGKLLAALVDVVEELADQTTANEEALKELNEQLDELTESLDVLETLVVARLPSSGRIWAVAINTKDKIPVSSSTASSRAAARRSR